MTLITTAAKLFGGWTPAWPKLTPAPGPASATRKANVPKSHYDYRIDFFRGLSLIFIFINHIPDNVYSYLTSRTFSLFDSAEVFMFLAGYSAALGYYGLVGEGLQAFSRKALNRARAILTYHVILVALIMAAAFVIGEWSGIKTGYEVFLEKIETDPLDVLIGTPLLAFQAPLLDILPMYVIVMLMAPFLVWLRAKSELSLLVASGLMWMFASRFFPNIPTLTADVTWNFNPFCWQFLFAIGVIFGWRTRANMTPVASGDARLVLDVCCGLFVLFSACVLLTIDFQTFNDVAANRLRAMYFSLNKQCLDLWRVVGLLASAYLVARLVDRDAAWLKAGVSRWICAAGAASLPIFSLTVVLSFAGKFIVMGLNHTFIADTIATGLGIAIIILTALALKGGYIRAALNRVVLGPNPRNFRVPQ